jgi:hypothetical protein
MAMSDSDKQQYYIKEKALKSLSWVAETVDCLNEEKENIPASVLKELKICLGNSLQNSTKVVAALFDSIHKQNWDDVDLILEKGKKGLDEVLYKYGCISEPDHVRRDRERPQFISTVLQISKGDVREGRRAIYDECDRFGPDPLIAQIRNLLEGVTQGSKPWSDFQQEIEHLLSSQVGKSSPYKTVQ